MSITLFEVGGCVRDSLMGVASKDIDFAVEAPSFDVMHDTLVGRGFTVFQVIPDRLTMRAKFPKDHPNARLTADFVQCRKDGPSSDARHPDFVEPGTIWDDLARRDFRVNAMARTETGELLDPHNGQQDLADGVLRCVGDPNDRFTEDSLRVLRALRFTITKGFKLSESVIAAMHNPRLPELLASVSTERIREELHKAFAVDTLRTMELLMGLRPAMRQAIFRDGLSLKPTMERM